MKTQYSFDKIPDAKLARKRRDCKIFKLNKIFNLLITV